VRVLLPSARRERGHPLLLTVLVLSQLEVRVHLPSAKRETVPLTSKSEVIAAKLATQKLFMEKLHALIYCNNYVVSNYKNCYDNHFTSVLYHSTGCLVTTECFET
jgi:hypothetical protein